MKTLLGDNNSLLEDEEIAKQQVFSVIDDDAIRLSVYRHLSNIHNKWIGGRLEVDNKSLSCIDDKPLIDRFRFMDRGYNDIGEKLFLNPFPNRQVVMLRSNPGKGWLPHGQGCTNKKWLPTTVDTFPS